MVNQRYRINGHDGIWWVWCYNNQQKSGVLPAIMGYNRIIWYNMAILQWEFQDPKNLEVPTIYEAYFLGLCKGICPQNVAKHMVQYLHISNLKFPLVSLLMKIIGRNWENMAVIGATWENMRKTCFPNMPIPDQKPPSPSRVGPVGWSYGDYGDFLKTESAEKRASVGTSFKTKC